MTHPLLTASCILLALLPWSILPLRAFDWALRSPIAEILISADAALMLLGGIYTLLCYGKLKVQNVPMKACLLINSLYAAAGLAILCQMFLPK